VAANFVPSNHSTLISEELQGLHSLVTLYSDNIIETVPFLRQFASTAIVQTLLRHQVLQEYLSQQYPV